MRNKVSWQLKREFYSEILHVPDMLSDFPGDENATLEAAHIFWDIFSSSFRFERRSQRINKGRGL